MFTEINEILDMQRQIYQNNFLQHGDCPRGTFQNDNITIDERYYQLVYPMLPFLRSGFSICDFGSGTCGLHAYLLKNSIEHRYTGIEIVPEMRDAAAKKYPQIRVLGENILEPSFTERFDLLVASGTFNLKGSIPVALWERYIFEIIAKMFSLSNVGIAFNALSAYSDFRENYLYYLSPELAVRNIQGKLSRFFQLSSLWPLYEFSYTILHCDPIAASYKEREFRKYFNQFKRDDY